MRDPEARQLTGAFVARLWPDVRGLRARVRHTIDLSTPEIEATTTGPGQRAADAARKSSASHPAACAETNPNDSTSPGMSSTE